MTSSQLILIIFLLGYCLTDIEPYDCEKVFEERLKKKNEEQCLKIGTCSYNFLDKTCIPISSCSKGEKNNYYDCQRIIPENYNTTKCDIGTNGICTEFPRECSDWRKLGFYSASFQYTTFTNDICSNLKPPNGEGNRCELFKISSTEKECRAQFNGCTGLSTRPICEGNIPETKSIKCEWISPATGSEYCKESTRYCDENYNFIVDKEICWGLAISEIATDPYYNKLKCIYNGDTCQSVIEKCEYIIIPDDANGDYCDNFVPLNQTLKDYNYKQKCTFDNSNNKCKQVTRKCKDFNIPIPVPNDLLNEDFCNELEVTDSNLYRCAYDEENNKCYEEYKECDYYISEKVETDREGCENIKFKEKTKKCVYDIKEDKCETKQIYQKCEDYKGKEKKTCESILSTESNLPYCILDRDSICVERPFTCSEAFTQEDCLNIAKANDDNKRCAWDSSGCTSTWCEPVRNADTCYEEYIRCEDYLGTEENACKKIRLYDGKKCKWESGRCRSNNKICDDAKTEEECKLIAETGVSDTERKVCAWSFDKCRETYKYCSDYRESCTKGNSVTSSETHKEVKSDCQDFCENIIKPYNESGKYLDIGFKCYYEYGVGCQKVQVECKDAGTNPILCELYNDYIYDRDKTYCGFFEGTCKKYYKNCEEVEIISGVTDSQKKCTDNIVQEEGGIYRLCKTEGDKCVKKDSCTLLGIMTSQTISPTTQPYIFYKDLCERINPNCSFSFDIDPVTSNVLSYQCKFDKEKTCEDIKFYTDDDTNKENCERMPVSKPYKKCILKEDKSGCEEVYQELSYSTASISYSEPPNADTQGNSSSYFTINGIHLIILLLSLLY